MKSKEDRQDQCFSMMLQYVWVFYMNYILFL